MKSTQFLIKTKKETPKDAVMISHKLMIRAGIINQLGAGVYSWLPLGTKIIAKIKEIIRIEMNKSGALELFLPSLQPASIWQQTGRWQKYGNELFKLKDRNESDYCLAPTHEEVITKLAKDYITSYKELPINWYQIHTKFRDEKRPRSGVLRAREFIMKDAYSFHIKDECLNNTFDIMKKTYCNIFDKLSLNYRLVQADSGTIGGEHSIEYQAITESGEDTIVISDSSNYAANIEKATYLRNKQTENIKMEDIKEIDTPNVNTIKQASEFIGINIDKIIKTILIKINDNYYALALRGDHTINENKVKKILNSDFIFAEKEEIKNKFSLDTGSIGICNLPIPIIADYDAINMINFTCGANKKDKHIMDVNWQKNVKNYTAYDIRNAEVNDNSPDGKGKLKIKKSIEIGHIFKLEDSYTKKVNANIINELGKAQAMKMGCYGIGVSRILAAIIEQNNDDKGIKLPQIIAPFEVAIIPINYHKSNRVKEYCEKIYQNLKNINIDVLLEDRKQRAGFLFADMDLIGINHHIIISDTQVDNQTIEYKNRINNNKEIIKLDKIIDFIKAKIKNA